MNIYVFWNFFFALIETVCVILSDPPCKVGYAQFTTVPLKPYMQKWVFNFCIETANENKRLLKNKNVDILFILGSLEIKRTVPFR